MSISALLGRYLRRLEPRGHWDGFVHTPLDRLPMVAIDCETTNLNPRRDRIVSSPPSASRRASRWPTG